MQDFASAGLPAVRVRQSGIPAVRVRQSGKASRVFIYPRASVCCAVGEIGIKSLNRIQDA
jgi:hypothetical protein